MTPRTATWIGFSAVLLWSLFALLTTATGAVPPFLLSAMTFFLGGLVGVVGLVVRGKGFGVFRQRPSVWALGTVGLFGYHALYFAALRISPPAEAGLIDYLWPLLIVLLSARLLPGERLRGVQVVGALLGFLGIVVLLLGSGEVHSSVAYWPGYLCALAAAFVWALYSVLSRRFPEVPTDAVAGFCLLTAVLSLLSHWAFEKTVWPQGMMQWLALIALGIGPVGVAFYAWDIGVKRGDIRLLGVSSYAAPVLSTSLLVLAGRAKASVSLYIACALIVAGAAVATRGREGGASAATS